MIADNRDLTAPDAGAYLHIQKRADDTFLYNVDFSGMLGGEAWINNLSVASPPVGPGSNYLNAVKLISTSDGWAVGFYNNAAGIAQTLTLRYNGTLWSQVTSANQTVLVNGNTVTTNNYLTAVYAVSATEAYAVGNYYSATGKAQPLLLTYNNGASRWDIAATPPPPRVATDMYLTGISCPATGKYVLCGYFYGDGADSYNVGKTYPLIYSWSGSAWTGNVTTTNSGITTPAVANSDNIVLNGVITPSASVCYVAGHYTNTSVGINTNQPLVFKSTDTEATFTNATMPNITDTGGYHPEIKIMGIAGFDTTHVFICGSLQSSVDAHASIQNVVFFTTDGSTWSRDATVPQKQNSGADTNQVLRCITCLSTEVYVGGHYFSNSNSKAQKAVIHKFIIGGAWSSPSIVDPLNGAESILGLHETSNTNIAFVGFKGANALAQTSSDGTSWTNRTTPTAASLVPGSASPPAVTVASVPPPATDPPVPNAPTTANFVLGGGGYDTNGVGWSGTCRLAVGVTFPSRGPTDPVSRTGYVKFVNLTIDIL